MSQFEKLFEPLRIGSMEVKNRIAMAPMTVDYGNDDETPSDRQIAYYSERAKGGVGLMGLEVTTVDPKHRYQQHSIGLHSDEQIKGHKKLVDAIHQYDVKVQPQISHTGPESLSPFYQQLEPMGASVIRTETTKQACREITVEELEIVIELYGDAARRAQEAGYDGIELHAAHSYMMLGSFLSPLRNFRTDEYAGHKFEGRVKLLLQVLANIRQKTGEDFPITVRISGFERESGGRELNDTQRLAPLLVKAGVNCFHVSGGVGDGNITQIITGPEFGPGFNVPAAAAIKRVVPVPVMVVGQNMDPVQMEAILANGQADLIAMARGLLADPDFPLKVKAGKVRDINRCILCQDCVDTMATLGSAGTTCAVNPRCGRESEFPLTQAATSKKVLVIGGGPGGMAAAHAAAMRGHRVTLMEMEAELGGAFRWASKLFPHNQLFLDYLKHQLESLPIEVLLESAATEESIRQANPDAVIVATGGKLEVPDIPGADRPNVIAGAAIRELVAKSTSDATQLPSGDAIAVIGANLMGLELAEFLARRGKRVHVLESSARYAMPAGKKRRNDHAKTLDRLGVSMNTGIHILGITEEGVLSELGDGSESLLRVDTVIVVGEVVADSDFFERIRSVVDEVHCIGDSLGFGLSKKAVAEAMEAAYRL